MTGNPQAGARALVLITGGQNHTPGFDVGLELIGTGRKLDDGAPGSCAELLGGNVQEHVPVWIGYSIDLSFALVEFGKPICWGEQRDPNVAKPHGVHRRGGCYLIAQGEGTPANLI